MKIDHTDKTPLYIQLRDIIKAKIESGEWKEGSLIPGENKISEMFNVSRVTVRQALNLLVEDNYLYKRPGFGTVVYKNKASLSNFTLVQSFTNELNEMGLRNDTLEAELLEIEADDKLATIFNIEIGHKLYNLRRLRGTLEAPILFSSTYLLPIIELPNDEEFLYNSLYDYLTKQNVVFALFEESISAVEGSSEILQKLNLKQNFLIKRVRHSYDLNNILIEYTENFYNPHLYSYRVEIVHKRKEKRND